MATWHASDSFSDDDERKLPVTTNAGKSPFVTKGGEENKEDKERNESVEPSGERKSIDTALEQSNDKKLPFKPKYTPHPRQARVSVDPDRISEKSSLSAAMSGIKPVRTRSQLFERLEQDIMVTPSRKVGLSSGARYALSVLNEKDLGKSNGFCGGQIGDGRRMCITNNCEVKEHAKPSKKMTEIFLELEDQVFIQAQPWDKNKTATSVFTAPSVAASAFGSSLQGFLDNPKALETWQPLFASLALVNTGSTEAADRKKQEVLEVARKEVAYGVTPLKPTPFFVPPPEARSANDNTYESEDSIVSDLDDFLQGTPRPRRIHREEQPRFTRGIDEIPLSLPGEDPNSTLEKLRLIWPNLINAVKGNTEQLEDQHSDSSSFRDQVRSILQELEFKVASLRTLIGARPERFGTLSLFDLLRS